LVDLGFVIEEWMRVDVNATVLVVVVVAAAAAVVVVVAVAMVVMEGVEEIPR